MKKNQFAGTGKVFGFTLKHLIGSKGWLLTTFITAFLLIVGIPCLLYFIASQSTGEKAAARKAKIERVLVVDETEGNADYSVLTQVDYTAAQYDAYDNMDQAIEAAAAYSSAIILNVTKSEDYYSLKVYLPEQTDVSRSSAGSYGEFAASAFQLILMQKAELDEATVQQLSQGIMTDTISMSADAETESDSESISEMLFSMLIPFICLMAIYMMIILYGQSTANSVMLEKNSKLMETILTAVHPSAMMAGKLLANAFAAVLQLFIWIAAFFFGIMSGAAFALQMVPDTTNDTVNTINSMTEFSMDISMSGLALGLVIVALGFFLYLSLSCISGALAAKPEELNKTSIIYMIFLLLSFLLSMASFEEADTTNSLLSTAEWLNYFPFTAILVTPGRLITKEATLIQGCISAAILLVSVLICVWAAGKIYQMFILYRGETPTVKNVVSIIRKQAKETSGIQKDIENQ
ncbi:MAG: ABC transporter permease [Oscillospiraceae bacterium]|nr:ABC transporter permease [Oscillospiraceae bacterium]